MTALLRAKLSWRLDGAASHAPTWDPFSRTCARCHMQKRPSQSKGGVGDAVRKRNEGAGCGDSDALKFIGRRREPA